MDKNKEDLSKEIQRENKICNEITNARKEFSSLQKYKGYGFNLLKIPQKDKKLDELETCRLIHDLLSPKGTHGQGSKFLEIFSKKILKINFKKDDLDKAEVFREYLIVNQRRIDLFLKIGGFSIPIEVKIWAKDQNNQCNDYFKRTTAPDGYKRIMYYLTPDGHDPSEESKNDTINVENISFSNDIIPWLDECAKSVLDITRLRDSLLQIKQVIEEMCNMNNDIKQAVKEVIKKSHENFLSAISIKNNIVEIETDFLKNIFEKISDKVKLSTNKEKIDKNPKWRNQSGHDDSQRILNYYKKGEYPGINFKFEHATLPENIEIWVRAEIFAEKNNGFFISYYNVKKDKDGNLCEMARWLGDDDICNSLKINKDDIFNSSNSWILANEEAFNGEYLEKKNNLINKDEWPDFKVFNEACFNLFSNEDCLDKFTTLIANRIIFLLNRQ